MGIHGGPHCDQRLLVKALSSCKSTGFSLLTRFKKFQCNCRAQRKDSFQAIKSATMTVVKSIRSVATKRRRNHVISQDSGEKSPTYIVGDTEPTSSIVESGEDLADPECAQDAPEGLPQTRPQDFTDPECAPEGLPQTGPQDFAYPECAQGAPEGLPQTGPQDPADPECAHDAPEGLPQTRPQDLTDPECAPEGLSQTGPQDFTDPDCAQCAPEGLPQTRPQDFADPECAQGAPEGLPQTRPQDNLKRKASTSEDSQPEMMPPAKRAAIENIIDLLIEVIGFSLPTRFRKFQCNFRALLKDSFQAIKSATMTVVKCFRLIAITRHRDRVISQDSGEKSPTYIVGDIEPTSSIAESGEDCADPECAEDASEGLPQTRSQDLTDPECKQCAPEGLPQTRPQDNLKMKASPSDDSQPEMLPPDKRAAIENVTDLLIIIIIVIIIIYLYSAFISMVLYMRRGGVTPEIETPQVEMPDIGNQENNLPPELLTILQSKGEEGYLDDEVIIMAQDLLQRQFKGFDGLQPPCALMIPGYSVLQNAVQIHYDADRVHWLTTCYKNGQIFVADSFNIRNLSPSIHQQINNMYSIVVDNPLEHLRFIDVDQQKNWYDCGLYAIAFAYEFMADGGEPRAEFQHQKMRTHLISCLQNNRISGFPKKVRE